MRKIVTKTCKLVQKFDLRNKTMSYFYQEVQLELLEPPSILFYSI